ncbi:hypothetical protein [Alkalicoccobacillus porphyridii]|uniref:Uncharacterized protein n=1 Tax=Alkalicoccobacillus porphyridii TaxID=2597270 RepID=A0A553ZYZ7_9BACI|nr:hypothetical protein [Alkalicoccobacillus porphyridii]TSB46677.1 hypothetical protein FN960_09995 [Alkalicoccobacillus porphyridii]
MTYLIHATDNRYDDILQKVISYLHLHKQLNGDSPTIPEIANYLGNSEELILESLEYGEFYELHSLTIH